ncbi:MAG: glycosyltransferase family 39 protein [Chloroflexi bacterium]|nr:glycosyltransferase family 39 protein [Chloroflexota bacterium]
MWISVIRSTKFRTLVILFISAFLIRLFFLAALTDNNAVETGRDAQGYFNRAIGYENVLRSLLSGNRPSSTDLARAYTSGWPPLQSLVLGVGFVFFGHTLFAARLIMVLLSALTAPPVYLVTEKLANRRAALMAALLFAIYPSFVHFSFRLFSETTFIFLLFFMLLMLMLTSQASNPRRAIVLAAVTGSLLGLATLVRAVGIVLIPVAMLWAARQVTDLGKGLLTAVVIFSAACVAVLPWEATMYALEGRVFVVTRAVDVSDYLGQSPTTVNMAGKLSPPATSDDEAKIAKAESMPRFQKKPWLPQPLHEWTRTWTPDFALYRYLLMLGFPPLDPLLVGSIFWLTFACFGFFLILALWGLWIPAPALQLRFLIVAFVAAIAALHMVTYGQSRYGITLLALLVPAAGHGLANAKQFFEKANRRWAGAALACAAVMGASTYSGLPYEYSTVASSSYYVQLIRGLDVVIQSETQVGDRILFRVVGEQYTQDLAISLVGDDYEFADSTARRLDWRPSPDRRELDVATQSATASEPVQLIISSDQSPQAAIIALTPAAWHQWQPTGLPGIEYLWLGSNAYRETDLDAEAPRF